MLVLLPPSETKVSGGLEGSSLDLSRLSPHELTPLREQLLQAVVEQASDPVRAMKDLKLGPKGAPEVDRNREVWSSPTMKALSRYTGVLYDALGVSRWSADDWSFAKEHVAVFSALFGLIRAHDPIPAYRLSCDSTLGEQSVKKYYAPYQEVLWGGAPDFVVDLRSEGYRALAPLPLGRGVFVNLVKPGPVGARKALGHHNKMSKGLLVKDIVATRAHFSEVVELSAWGVKNGWNFDVDSQTEGTIDLVVEV